MKQEELQLLRNLRMAASAEAAFLNGELSMLGKSFNYDTDLKLARCELDALECLIGLIDCRFAAYKGTWSLGDAVIRSEAGAESEIVASATAAPVRKRGRKPKAVKNDPSSTKTEMAPLQAFERPAEATEELQKREDACVALWEETHDWQRVLGDEPLMVESSSFRHEVAKRCGLRDDGTHIPQYSDKDRQGDADFLIDDSKEAMKLRERSARLLNKTDDRLADELDAVVDEGQRGKTIPVLGMELEIGMIVEFPSTRAAAMAVDPDADTGTARQKVVRCARRMWWGLFNDGPDAIRKHEDFEKMTYNGWAFQFKNAEDW